MQFVKHGNKFKVVRYAGFDRDKKRPILEIVGTLDLDGCCGLKLSAAMQSGKLKESELQEIEAKKRELREAHRLASIPELPYVLENALTLIVSLTPEEWAAQDATWQRRVAHNGRMFAEILDQLGAPTLDEQAQARKSAQAEQMEEGADIIQNVPQIQESKVPIKQTEAAPKKRRPAKKAKPKADPATTEPAQPQPEEAPADTAEQESAPAT